MSEQMTSILEFAQICGAGGLACTLILWFYWHRDVRDRVEGLETALDAEREYIRQTDKEQLKVLQELTSVIADSEAGGHDRHGELVKRIDEAVETLIKRIDATKT